MGDKAEREIAHSQKKWRVTDVVQVVRAAAQSRRVGGREGEKRGNAHRKFEAGMADTDAAGANVRGNARKLRQRGEKWGSWSQNTFTFFLLFVCSVALQKTQVFFLQRKHKNTVSTDIQQRAQTRAGYRRESHDERVNRGILWNKSTALSVTTLTFSAADPQPRFIKKRKIP